MFRKITILIFILAFSTCNIKVAKADCWYNSSWSFRIAITVQAAQVSGSHTNFPVYLDLADLAATNFFAQVRADGGDIRITMANGQTELPREIVSINTGASTGELHFLAPELSGGEVFYIYYGNAAATDYATSDPFGAENVWATDYIAVYHMETITPSVMDSTSSSFDGTSINMTTIGNVSTGVMSNAILFNEDAVSFDRVSLPRAVLNGRDDFTISLWFRSSVASATQAIWSSARAAQSNEFLIWTPATTQVAIFNSGSQDTFNAGFNYFDLAWHKIDVVRDGTGNQVTVYMDGSSIGTIARATSPLSIDAGGLILGEEQDSVDGGYVASQAMDGLLDHITVSTELRSTNWLTTKYNNQNNPTTFWNVGTEESDNLGTGWYGCDWKRRQIIKVEPTQVSGLHVNFPVYFDLNDLAATDFFDEVQASGADIRITTCDGTTEIPREIVSLDNVADTGELHFRIPNISGGEEFFIYYANPTATNYATTDPFGAENVWTNNYLVVYHMQEDPSTGTLLDSSSNSNDGTPQNMGGEATVTGQIGQAYDFDGANEYIATAIDGSEFDEITVSTWFNNDRANVGSGNYIYDNSPGTTGYSARLESGGTRSLITFAYTDTSADIATHGATATSTWYYLNQTIDGTNLNIYVDGSLSDAEPQNAVGIRDTSDTFEIARHSDNDVADEFDGTIDELRISTVARDANWISTEYNNQNNPSTFWDLTVTDDVLDIVSFTPADNGTAASVTANLEILFDNPPTLLNGDVIVRRISDDTAFDTYDTNGTTMTITGNSVSIRIPTPLFYNDYYYVELGCGAFGPATGAPFPGFDDNGIWNFIQAVWKKKLISLIKAFTKQQLEFFF
jgi:hypothetical protein